MQIGQELRPFPTETGAQIVILHEGKKNHVDMFDKEHSSMAMESWVRYCILCTFSTFKAIGKKYINFNS